MTLTRTCLLPGCGRLTPCPLHPKVRYSTSERQRMANAVAAHRELYGNWCNGDEHHTAHPCTDLTADHVTPISVGAGRGTLEVKCRASNSARGNR